MLKTRKTAEKKGGFAAVTKRIQNSQTLYADI